jgi:hypothetical protein
MSLPRSEHRADEIHPEYLERRLHSAAEAAQHFRVLLSTHSARLRGLDACFERFHASLDIVRQNATCSAMYALEESHNELCIAEELLFSGDGQFALVEYEPRLPYGDRRIDFRATKDRAVWFVEVKTIHPLRKDRWDQYERIVEGGQITDNVTIHFERQSMGGELWHQRFSARAKMMEYSVDFENRVRTGGVDSPDHRFVLALFSDGFAWHEDELEDFVAFYRTGQHRLDDGLAKMERHVLEMQSQPLTQRISAFAYFCRPPFAQTPTEKNWNVRPPKGP